jgi:hypothetical protein
MLMVAGCGSDTASEPPPEVFAVTGTIADSSGAKVTAGMLEFRSTTGAESSAQADIQPDGSFTVFTLFEGEKLAGAAPGEYNVTFYPPMSQSQTEVPVSLDAPLVVEKTENRFEVKLP